MDELREGVVSFDPPPLVLKIELHEGESEGGPPDGGAPANADVLVDGEHEDKGVCKRTHDKQDLLD